MQICCINLPRISTNKIQPNVPFLNLTGRETSPTSRHVEGPPPARRPAPGGRASAGLVPRLQERPRARSRPHSRAPPIRSAEPASRETSLGRTTCLSPGRPHPPAARAISSRLLAHRTAGPEPGIFISILKRGISEVEICIVTNKFNPGPRAPSPPQSRARGRPGDACGHRAGPPRRACLGGARARRGGLRQRLGARNPGPAACAGVTREPRRRPGARVFPKPPGAGRAQAAGAPNSGDGRAIGAHEGASPPSPGRRRGSEAGRGAGAARRGRPGCRQLTWLALRPRGLLRLSSRSGSSARPGTRAAPRNLRANLRAAAANGRDRRECPERSARASAGGGWSPRRGGAARAGAGAGAGRARRGPGLGGEGGLRAGAGPGGRAVPEPRPLGRRGVREKRGTGRGSREQASAGLSDGGGARAEGAWPIMGPGGPEAGAGCGPAGPPAPPRPWGRGLALAAARPGRGRNK